MNVAHMIGEHHHNSLSQQLAHILSSWAGFIIAIMLGLVLCYVVYKQVHRRTIKQEVKRK